MLFLREVGQFGPYPYRKGLTVLFLPKLSNRITLALITESFMNFLGHKSEKIIITQKASGSPQTWKYSYLVGQWDTSSFLEGDNMTH